MAQHKYDLMTLPTTPACPPRHHPWYKERLDLKYSKRGGQKTGLLDGRRWTLLAGNMDDFRSGAPAPIPSGSMVVKGKVDPVPLVNLSRSLPSSSTSSNRRRTLPSSLRPGPGLDTLHSKVGSRRQSKLNRLRQLEEKLLERPLSLYPHLRDSIPPEVASDVVSMLEGDSKAGSVCRDDIRKKPANKEKEDTGLEEKHIKEEKEEEEERDVRYYSSKRKIYRWPLKQTEEDIKEERRKMAAQNVISPAQEARVNQVTRNLVQWGKELGGSGEVMDIDETTVKNLFSNDYESRALTSQERVVDVSEIPLELLKDGLAENDTSGGDGLGPLWEVDNRRRALTVPVFSSDLNVYKKSPSVKSRYGAWYLPTNLWKVQKPEEPLQDPRTLASKSVEELARQEQELDMRLSQLHGTRAFREYYAANKPGSNLPSFLQFVDASGRSQEDLRHSTRGRIAS